MAPNLLLAAVSALLVAIATIGLYEYRLYSPEERERAGRALRALLGVWIATVAVGLIGLAVGLAGGTTRGLGVYVVLALAVAGPLVQARAHGAMDRDHSPLVDRYL